MNVPKIPSDFRILETIYKKYYNGFTSFNPDDSSRSTKIWVPIDVEEIARDLKVDPDIVFGRFHYFLNQKYSYENADQSRVSLFELGVGDDRHCVNFPLMTSLYAEMLEQRHKHNTAIWIAVGSLLISVIAILVSVMQSLFPS